MWTLVLKRTSPAPKRLFWQNHRVKEHSRARALMPWRQMCVNKQGTQPPPEKKSGMWNFFYLSRNHRSWANVLIDDERIFQREIAVLIDWWYLCGEENAHSRDKKRAECPRIHPAHSHRLGRIITVFFDTFLQDRHHVNEDWIGENFMKWILRQPFCPPYSTCPPYKLYRRYSISYISYIIF